MLREIVLATAATAAIFAGLNQPASAQQAGGLAIEIPEVRNYVGLAIGAIPDYMGSDDYDIGIGPAGVIKFGESERFVKLIATELSVNLLDSRSWSAGPVLNYRFGRDDVEDDTVDRLRDIDGTLEAGVFVGWAWIGEEDPRHRFATSLQAVHDVASEHEGYLVSASARYFRPVTRQITLSAGVSATYGSSDYMDTYFGIDADNAARSGLSEFNADGGIRDIRFPIMAIYSLSPQWHVTGGLIYQRLLSDASDSPVVDDRGSANQLFVGGGVAYAW